MTTRPVMAFESHDGRITDLHHAQTRQAASCAVLDIFEALTNPEQRSETTHIESDLRVGGMWKKSGTGFGRL
jgi:hypothetical protein